MLAKSAKTENPLASSQDKSLEGRLAPHVGKPALQVAGTLLMVLYGLFSAIPLLWMLVGSFSTDESIFANSMPFSLRAFVPYPFTLEGYNLLISSGFFHALQNTICQFTSWLHICTVRLSWKRASFRSCHGDDGLAPRCACNPPVHAHLWHWMGWQTSSLDRAGRRQRICNIPAAAGGPRDSAFPYRCISYRRSGMVSDLLADCTPAHSWKFNWRWPDHHDQHLAVFPLASVGWNNISSGVDSGFTRILSTGAHHALECNIRGKRYRRRGPDSIAGNYAASLPPQPSDFWQ